MEKVAGKVIKVRLTDYMSNLKKNNYYSDNEPRGLGRRALVSWTDRVIP
jgi:hypothetical protein